MANPARNDKYCIIGAGASGLAVAKNFKAARHSVRLPRARGGSRRSLEHRHRQRHRLRDHASGLRQLLDRLRRHADGGRGLSRPIPATSGCSATFATTSTKFGLGRPHRVRQSVERVAVARRQAVGSLGRRRRLARASIAASCGERTSRRAAHADLSRQVRRRDHPLARLQEPTAGARQARAGGRLRQLGGRYRRPMPCTAARACS